MGHIKHVLYVAETFTPHDKRFLQAIGRQIDKVWFAFFDSTNLLKEISFPKAVEVWPGTGKPISTWQKLINFYGIQIVHAGPLNSVLPMIAGKIACPLVGMSWGSDILVHASEDIEQREKIVKTLKDVDSLIVDCKSVINKLNEWVPDFNIPYTQFPWGVELKRFKTLPKKCSLALRDELGWKNDTVIISTRSWSSLYGIPTLIEAFYLLLQQLPDAKLVLVGDGELREQVWFQIKNLNIEDKIHCPGHLHESDLPLWYGVADIYISTSLGDGSSVSLLEAMACGLPAIVHNKHGNLEWVQDMENGWLVDCQNPEAICETIFKAIRSTALLKKMSVINREKILDKADWVMNSKNIFKAYNDAVENYTAKNGTRVI